MVESKREIMYLPKQENVITDTTGFAAMKAALTKVSVKAEEDSKARPTLRSQERGCPPPSKLLYEPDKPIETICAVPQTVPDVKEPDR
jgi:hypothetical protein